MVNFGCQSKKVETSTEKVSEAAVSVKFQNTGIGIQLTEIGESTGARWFQDSNSIIFQSRGRENHKQFQIYSLDLSSKKERRLTYQDGNAVDPLPLENKNFMYSSDTDETKEKPTLLTKKVEELFPANEIYLSDYYGEEISRLTKRPLFDGALKYASDFGSPILYASLESGFLQIHSVEKKGQTKEVFKISGKNVKELVFAKNKKIGFYVTDDGFFHFKDDFKKATASTLPAAQVKDLLFLEKEQLLFFSATPTTSADNSKSESEKTQLFLFDITANCLKLVLKDQSNLSNPSVKSDRNEILFTSDRSGHKQIYKASIDLGALTCL